MFIFECADDPENKPKTIVDVGCGIGGSSRYLARRYGAQCTGITLSPVQAERGNALTAAEGLSHKVSLQVADALEQPFPDGMFDMVWSMESGEHMPDKTKVTYFSLYTRSLNKLCVWQELLPFPNAPKFTYSLQRNCIMFELLT
jgi:cyclopropane fatty-acyl-phospholipid synthase-like methyltransferase